MATSCEPTRPSSSMSSSACRGSTAGGRTPPRGSRPAVTTRRSRACMKPPQPWPAVPLRAVEAILRGDVEHAFHPGGGLHHAMAGRASGFCIYDDPALAIARARADRQRILYVDLDVHHGDGVEAIHAADPGVVTISFHETGRSLFPGTGFVDEVGAGTAAGSIVNVPLEAETGEAVWFEAVRTILPEVGAAVGPDLVVSQHGADSHAWDPLAHLRNTTTAMGRAARLVDDLAHRHAGGRWLATGGGGYDVYGVVPRVWSLVWLAGAHRDAPDRIPTAWRERWAGEAARYGSASLPATFLDEPNAGDPPSQSQDAAERRSRAMIMLARELAVPRLLREARDRGWWDPLGEPGTARSGRPAAAGELDGPGGPSVTTVTSTSWEQLRLAPRVVAPDDPAAGHRLVAAALASGARVIAAVAGNVAVGVAISVPARQPAGAGFEDLLAVGVTPTRRRSGLATSLLAELVRTMPAGRAIRAAVGVAERDVHEPLDRALRATIARRLLVSAGFTVDRAPDPVGRADPQAIVARRG